jgi:hypothetical protein
VSYRNNFTPPLARDYEILILTQDYLMLPFNIIGDALSPSLFNFAWNTSLGGSTEPGKAETEWDTPAFGLRWRS